ncbi:L-rhamnose mutarotase [Pontiella sulfatireligans]|uniref:L-rhamnose mutarotase n=1 Tax=Pontiella sulfatireligans TaxID=2750658 RepID=A0A6C2UG67_9BACT|nr:L-rhamnose mutarotase [Pontiella sulfatireligans]VGO18206.1 L-rhamnose mutarotase [Pontiella sulfatireligans]
MKSLLAAALALLALPVFAFSPYESYLQSGKQTHVGLIAVAKDGKTEELASALKTLNEKKAAKAFKKADITNLSTYSKELQGKTWVMVYFDYDGDNYLEAVQDFESVKATQTLEALVAPHPRAKRYGDVWLQMEWINYIHGAKPIDDPDRLAMVTRVKPEREQEYRMLHQSVWPGVTDQMARGNYHNFSIYFVEMGDELFEFFYVEYVGTDAEKDGKANKADPFNQRWWKITDACQDPLPDADGVWSKMDGISK